MRLLSLLFITLLFVCSCDSDKEKVANSISTDSITPSNSKQRTSAGSMVKGSLDRNTLAVDYAKIAIKEWFNAGPGKIEHYDLESPIVKFGSSINCDNKKIDFALVCFDDTVNEGCAFVFLEIKDDYFSSIISRGETSETPDQLNKAALEANEKTNDFWQCGDAD